MDKKEKVIMVVKRELLFREDSFQGFKSSEKVNYEARALESYEWMKRGLAEEDPNFKQPIAYSLIMNSRSKKIFAYQRASHDAKYQEKRLQGKWSWGVGGHIEKLDIGMAELNPIQRSMQRELEEEIEMSGSVLSTRVLGYINDDEDAVGRVHFGLLYVVDTDSKVIKPKDPEIAVGSLMSIEDLEKIASSPDCKLEGWSRISLGQLRKILI